MTEARYNPAWIHMHVVLMDGSFLPLTTPIVPLMETAREMGVAGVVGYILQGKELVQVIGQYEDGPLAAKALASAADGLRLDTQEMPAGAVMGEA